MRVPRKKKSKVKASLSAIRTSSVRGVSWHKARSMWRVQYQHEGKRNTRYFPGTDDGKEEAEQTAEYWREENNPTPEEKAEAVAAEEEARAYFEERENAEEVFRKHREHREQTARNEAEQKRLQARDREATEAVIREGLRSLAKKAHPDAGGSNEEMQRLNATVQRLRQDVRNQQRIRERGW
ncbi:MAG: AP2 domain-containing protein [Acidobacteriaceae bacterium]